MLILSRKKNEEIMIGNEIKITIVETSGEYVKLGIEAPSDVKIFRKELYSEVELENKVAMGQDLSSLSQVKINLEK